MGAMIQQVLNPVDLTTVPGYRPSTGLRGSCVPATPRAASRGAIAPRVLRSGPYDPVHRRRVDPSGEPQMFMPKTPPTQNILGRTRRMERRTTPRRHRRVDHPDRTTKTRTARAAGCCSPTGTPPPRYPPPPKWRKRTCPAANSPCRYAPAPAPNNTATTSQPNAHATTNTTSPTRHRTNGPLRTRATDYGLPRVRFAPVRANLMWTTTSTGGSS